MEYVVSEFGADKLAELMTWFDSKEAVTQWSGPFMRYPLTSQSINTDLNLDKYISLSLVSKDSASQLLAFGQCYLRLERLHLARLVIKPNLRGNGMVAQLIDALIERGVSKYGEREHSLFVLDGNRNAARAYQKLGFKFANYPAQNPMQDCLYMIRLVRDFKDNRQCID